jgi:Chalcone isomerase-like
MLRRNLLLVLAAGLFTYAAVAVAAELIGVPGSSARYPAAVDARVDGQPVPMTLTGVALRKKLLFNVYAIASYVKEGTTVKTAEDLAALDVPKMFHLVMERDIEGKDLAGAFHEAVRLNHAAPEFDAEIKTLIEALKARAFKKGDQLYITHVPGIGVEFVVNGKTETVIRNVGFAKAVWEIYLGPKNIGTEIKAMLTARL